MTAAEFEAAVGSPLSEFACDCHSASLALVRSGVLGASRVARGWTPGVLGQHSWVVLGLDAYDETAEIVDPTLWSYVEEVEGIWVGRADERPHTPHGSGSIWEYGRPEHGGGETIDLEGDFSRVAQDFLDLLGPLDRHGWAVLAHAPVGGWPSGEIFAAMYQNPKLAPLLPIDVVGMATDLNPSGLYLGA